MILIMIFMIYDIVICFYPPSHVNKALLTFILKDRKKSNCVTDIASFCLYSSLAY